MFKQYLNSDYDIYDDGRCFSHKTNKFLTPQMSNKYPTYNLTLPDGKRKIYVHRLVAETFLPKIEGKDLINHIDGNTHNFNVKNLEWVNAKENRQHAMDAHLVPIGDQTPLQKDKDLPNEEWKLIKEFPNYKISNMGRVINKNTNRLLRPALSYAGYYEVHLWKDRKGTTKRIHQLVYKTFAEDENLSGYVINHKDGNKKNNNFLNLEKITPQENNYHATYIIKTNKSAKTIQQLNDNYEIIRIFPSIRKAEQELQISNISRAIKQGSKAGGFYWQFK